MMASPQLVIRPYEAADALSVWEAVRESMNELMPWMPWCHPNYSIEDSTTWLEAQGEGVQNGNRIRVRDHVLGGRLSRWMRIEPNRQGELSRKPRLLGALDGNRTWRCDVGSEADSQVGHGQHRSDSAGAGHPGRE